MIGLWVILGCVAWLALGVVVLVRVDRLATPRELIDALDLLGAVVLSPVVLVLRAFLRRRRERETRRLRAELAASLAAFNARADRELRTAPPRQWPRG